MIKRIQINENELQEVFESALNRILSESIDEGRPKGARNKMKSKTFGNANKINAEPAKGHVTLGPDGRMYDEDGDWVFPNHEKMKADNGVRGDGEEGADDDDPMRNLRTAWYKVDKKFADAERAKREQGDFGQMLKQGEIPLMNGETATQKNGIDEDGKLITIERMRNDPSYDAQSIKLAQRRLQAYNSLKDIVEENPNVNIEDLVNDQTIPNSECLVGLLKSHLKKYLKSLKKDEENPNARKKSFNATNFTNPMDLATQDELDAAMVKALEKDFKLDQRWNYGNNSEIITDLNVVRNRVIDGSNITSENLKKLFPDDEDRVQDYLERANSRDKEVRDEAREELLDYLPKVFNKDGVKFDPTKGFPMFWKDSKKDYSKLDPAEAKADGAPLTVQLFEPEKPFTWQVTYKYKNVNMGGTGEMNTNTIQIRSQYGKKDKFINYLTSEDDGYFGRSAVKNGLIKILDVRLVKGPAWAMRMQQVADERAKKAQQADQSLNESIRRAIRKYLY